MGSFHGDSLDVDLFDLKILGLLFRRGRITKIELSEAIGLSPTPCGARIERLEKSGVIRGYHADVDIELLANLTQYHVTVSIKEYTPQKARRFEAEVAKIINIVECEAVFGTIDYILKVYVASISHYHAVMAPLLEMEIDYTTYPVSRVLRHRVDLPLLELIGLQRSKMPSKK
jgi:Lrp/AsnC family transcriptional regulator, regulator of ectoine-degradation genes